MSVHPRQNCGVCARTSSSFFDEIKLMRRFFNYERTALSEHETCCSHSGYKSHRKMKKRQHFYLTHSRQRCITLPIQCCTQPSDMRHTIFLFFCENISAGVEIVFSFVVFAALAYSLRAHFFVDCEVSYDSCMCGVAWLWKVSFLLGRVRFVRARERQGDQARMLHATHFWLHRFRFHSISFYSLKEYGERIAPHMRCIHWNETKWNEIQIEIIETIWEARQRMSTRRKRRRSGQLEAWTVSLFDAIVHSISLCAVLW